MEPGRRCHCTERPDSYDVFHPRPRRADRSCARRDRLCRPTRSSAAFRVSRAATSRSPPAPARPPPSPFRSSATLRFAGAAPVRCRAGAQPGSRASGQIADRSSNEYCVERHARRGGADRPAIRPSRAASTSSPLQRLLDSEKPRASPLDLRPRRADRYRHGLHRHVGRSSRRCQSQALFFSATMPTEITRLVSGCTSPSASAWRRPRPRPADRPAHVKGPTSRATSSTSSAARPSAARLHPIKHGRQDRPCPRQGRHRRRDPRQPGQSQRERALAAFRDGSVRTLVATGIAARTASPASAMSSTNCRGPRDHVHRIDAPRVPAGGHAISLCNARAAHEAHRMLLPRSARSADSERPGAGGAGFIRRGEPRRRWPWEPRRDGGAAAPPHRSGWRAGQSAGRQPASTQDVRYDGGDGQRPF